MGTLESGDVCRPLPSGTMEGNCQAFLLPALGLVFCRACQAELSARVKQDESPLGATLGPALPTAGKESSVLGQNWAEMPPQAGFYHVLMVTTFTLPGPLANTIPDSRVRAPCPLQLISLMSLLVVGSKALGPL